MDEYIDLISSKYPKVYTPEKVKQDILPSLNKMAPILLNSLKKFLIEGELDEINLLGYSVKQLQEEYKMNEVAAYLTLDWIIKEPQKALESLEKGYDTIK